MNNILKEIKLGWEKQDYQLVSLFVNLVSQSIDSKQFIGIGAGRMGYSLRGFIMRLGHIGAKSFFIGDTTLPMINKNSIVIINSSSGETPTNVIYAKQAKEFGAQLCLFTQNKHSSISKLADLVITIPDINSNQNMKTFSEQYSYLLFDFIISEIIKKNSIQENFLRKNHSVFE